MTTSDPPSPRIWAPSRRQFIGGALAAGFLAACGGDESGTAGTGTTAVTTGAATGEAAGQTAGADGTVPTAAGTWTLVQRFPQNTQVPGVVRLPFSLSTGEASFILDGPAELGAVVTDLDGNAIGDAITAVRRDVEPVPYYAFRPTLDEPGFYRLVIEGGPEDGAAFDVAEPGQVQVPVPGDALAPFDTPTGADPGGVDPICTRQPMCPFHAVTLARALESGKAVAYLVGTPAFCATGTCGPGLDALIAVKPDYADSFEFVHAEVYTDDTATMPPPAVTELGLFYEPVLIVTDATGTIIDRLDAIWDESELRDTLDRA